MTVRVFTNCNRQSAPSPVSELLVALSAIANNKLTAEEARAEALVGLRRYTENTTQPLSLPSPQK